jgi:hypothetical protein
VPAKELCSSSKDKDLAELPKKALTTEEEEFQFVTDEPMPEFVELAAVVLDNAGINPGDTVLHAHVVAAELNAPHGNNQHPAVIKANPDEVVYKITFNLPDDGGMVQTNVG